MSLRRKTYQTVFSALLMGALAWLIPTQALRAQAQAEKTTSAPPAKPIWPKQPQKVVPQPKPAPKVLPPTITKSDIEDPIKVGNTGVVLAARIDSSIGYLGLNRCGPRIKQVIIALTDGMPASYYFEPTARIASQAPVHVTIESLSGTEPESGSRYSILTVNPDCSGFYTQTVTWPMLCGDVARLAFPNFRFERRIVANVDSFRASPLLQLSAMQATANTCVTVKKELFK